MKMRQNSGFILIIVLGLLGVLAYLALSLAEKSKLARTLSTAYLLESQTKLVARSGIEKGRQWILRPFLDTAVPSQADPLSGTPVPVLLPVDGELTASVRVADTSGRICLNDGIKAGQAELGALYKPQALDPWPIPEPTLPPTPREQDVSAWINMRLRSLLNAYGDVQRFAALHNGWPEWKANLANGTDLEPTYGSAVVFNHSATETADRFTSIPPRDINGVEVGASFLSAGLGDRIIGRRPTKGYTDVEEIRTILNRWWAVHKPVGHVETDFFARVSSDFTVAAWHDNAFWRMKREFGGNHAVYTDQANYQSNRTSPVPGTMVEIEVTPPDFTNLWKPHPVPPINLNTASDAVRAAVFQAPVNISLVCEGLVKDTVNWAAPSYPSTNIDNDRPTLGVGAPLARLSDMLENGFWLNTAGAPLLTQWQKNRLLSVRDAMICSQAYREVAQSDGWPDSFERFAWHLRRFLIGGGHQVRLIERANKSSSALTFSTYGLVSARDRGGTTSIASGSPGEAIHQWALAEFFPHIFSCQRRLPAWMGAPLALTFPWRRHSTPSFGIRSIEDFVFRSPLPKVVFQPTGIFILESSARLRRGPMDCWRRIAAVVQAYDTTVLRDQASFHSVTDLPATSPDILIGPEPGNLSSPFLGTVGLRDRGEVIPGGVRLNDGGPVLGTRYDFSGDFSPHASSVFERAVADSDPDNDPANGVDPGRGHEELLGSVMEDAAVSIFPCAGVDAGDISPFGGIFFSSFNHGRRSSTPFGDSFYFRPATFLIAPPPDNYLGTWGNSGLVSLWFRRPTGYSRLSTLMHMTLWDKAMVTLGPTFPGPTELRKRPVYFHLYSNSSGAGFMVGTGHCGLTGDGPPGIPDSGYYFQPWIPLKAMPLPTSAADYASNPVFRRMMPPWAQMPAAGTWMGDMLTNGTPRISEAGTSGSDVGTNNLYLNRAGGWIRLVARWDFSKIAPNLGKTELVVHDFLSAIHSNPASTGHGLFHPKMVMSFGERQYQVRPASSSSFTAPLGTLVPVNRLNSCIDNIVVQFGGLPNSNFETVPNNNATEAQMYNAIQAIPDFDNRRYNIRPVGHALGLSEPAWVVDPKLPAGSKILQFGARIYDVPFYPEFDTPAGTTYRRWPILAPRVDLGLTDLAGAFTAPTRSALPIVDQGIAIHSSAWSSYALKDAADARFRLTYRSVDAMDKSLTADVLTDIPWIQEVNWLWIPRSGMKVLSWKEE